MGQMILSTLLEQPKMIRHAHEFCTNFKHELKLQLVLQSGSPQYFLQECQVQDQTAYGGWKLVLIECTSELNCTCSLDPTQQKIEYVF